MHAVYERLEREGKIGGPYTFQEYPKWVTRADGKVKICETQAEELRFHAEATTGGPLTDGQMMENAATTIKSQDQIIKDLQAQVKFLMQQQQPPQPPGPPPDEPTKPEPVPAPAPAPNPEPGPQPTTAEVKPFPKK